MPPSIRIRFGAIAAHSPAPPPRTAPGDAEDEPRIDQGPFQTPEGIEAILGRHGFEQVRVTTEANEVRFDAPEHWIRWSWSHGARAVWESVPEDRHEAARADAVAALDELAGDLGDGRRAHAEQPGDLGPAERTPRAQQGERCRRDLFTPRRHGHLELLRS